VYARSENERSSGSPAHAREQHAIQVGSPQGTQYIDS